MEAADVDKTCWEYIHRILFGEIRWSQPSHFPVTKFNLTDDDLDTDRGEIILRLVRSNRGKVLRGLDDGVRNMSCGETALIKVRYDKAYTSFCMGTDIPPRANIVFTVELLSVNGKGRWGMATRQGRRFFRVFKKIWDRISVAFERFYYRMVRKAKGLKVITEPPVGWNKRYEEEYDSESSSVSIIIILGFFIVGRIVGMQVTHITHRYCILFPMCFIV